MEAVGSAELGRERGRGRLVELAEEGLRHWQLTIRALVPKGKLGKTLGRLGFRLKSFYVCASAPLFNLRSMFRNVEHLANAPSSSLHIVRTLMLRRHSGIFKLPAARPAPA